MPERTRLTECPFCGESLSDYRKFSFHLATPAGEGCPYTPLGPDDQLTGCEGVVSADKQTNEDSSPTLVCDRTERAANDGRKPSQNARLGAFDTQHKVSSAEAMNRGATDESD